ncbi:hypothetical protein M5K25_015421 [Dendrobium thyrsiflorum]|uniref:Uncharacterized protein n=1 Tax=Dendrobium thyrsiflorum TaxID=117978 RepID=A0ABD0UR09_DENTH
MLDFRQSPDFCLVARLSPVVGLSSDIYLTLNFLRSPDFCDAGLSPVTRLLPRHRTFIYFLPDVKPPAEAPNSAASRGPARVGQATGGPNGGADRGSRAGRVQAHRAGQAGLRRRPSWPRAGRGRGPSRPRAGQADRARSLAAAAGGDGGRPAGSAGWAANAILGPIFGPNGPNRTFLGSPGPFFDVPDSISALLRSFGAPTCKIEFQAAEKILHSLRHDLLGFSHMSTRQRISYPKSRKYNASCGQG